LVHWACADTPPALLPDAGTSENARLVILDPPGEAIGLALSASETLRVRYESASGAPIAGASVELGFVTSASERAGGATLSTTRAQTDSAGVARASVVAGAESANFRVRVTAPAAPPVLFYVQVSKVGFTALEVSPIHAGPRDVRSFARIELRLFGAEELSCAELDIDARPTSVFPPRSLAEFGRMAAFQNVGARSAYTLVAWAETTPGGTALAAGCVSLGADQLPPGPRALIDVVITDRPLAIEHGALLASTLDLTIVAGALAERGASRAWTVLGCPAGPGQLLLDGALAAASGTTIDAADCPLPTALPAALVDISLARGDPDELGCRPTMLATGEPTVDFLLAEAVAAGGTFPTGGQLAKLLAARNDVLSAVELGSQLTLTGPSTAKHRLDSLRFDVSGFVVTYDLLASSRPVLSQTQVLAEVDENGDLALGDHGFTLRLRPLCEDAFAAYGLAYAGLGERADDLGTALAQSVLDPGTSLWACSGMSAIVCMNAGLAMDCLVAGCVAAAALLDEAFPAWLELLDSPGLDAHFSGMAPLYDFDDDLVVDAIGTDLFGNRAGVWTVTIDLGDETSVSTLGSFGSGSGFP
jgi:hypothetical protein